MPDSIFHKSMRWGIICSVLLCMFFFSYLLVVWFFCCCCCCRMMLLFSTGWKRPSQLYQYTISGRGEILNYNGLNQIGLINLQWELKSETRQGMSDEEFHYGLCLSFYGALLLTRDVTFLSYAICLSVFKCWLQYNPEAW